MVLKRKLAWGLLAALAGPAAVSAQPVRLTPDIVISATPGADDSAPAVGADAAGRVVVAWNRRLCTGAGCQTNIRARRLDAASQPLGGEIEVSVAPLSPNGITPALAVSASGHFLLAWTTAASNGQGVELFARCYDGGGNPLGGEFRVDETGAVAVGSARAAPLAGGGYVLVWHQAATPSSLVLVQRRLDAACSPLGPPDQVHPPEIRSAEPAVAAAPGGGFLVVWSEFSGSRSEGISAQLYGAGGQRVGDRIAIVAPAPRPLETPAVAADPRGGFAVAWRNSTSAGTLLRRLDAGGRLAGPAIAADPLLDSSGPPRLAFDPAGGLLVAWSTLRNDLGCCAGRWFNPSGEPAGPVFSLSPRSGRTTRFEVAATAPREFFVVFENNLLTSESFNLRVLGSRFRIPPPGDEPCLSSAGVLSCDTLHDGGTAELSVPIVQGGLPLLGDLDGNGQDDPCAFDDGTFSCNLRHNQTRPATFRFGGASAGIPLLGDVNGDGRDDTCLHRRRRFACDTAHNGGTAEVLIFFGRLGTSNPLLGDVDGDGDDEPCVWEAGTFLCDTAHDGGAAEAGASFGEAGDLPLLGDVDGDGDDDFCVFRIDRFLCDTAHDGGEPEVEILFSEPGATPLLGNVDGF